MDPKQSIRKEKKILHPRNVTGSLDIRERIKFKKGKKSLPPRNGDPSHPFKGVQGQREGENRGETHQRAHSRPKKASRCHITGFFLCQKGFRPHFKGMDRGKELFEEGNRHKCNLNP